MPFDMVIFGMCEDDHTASLFPGHKNPTDQVIHAVYQSPKFSLEHVTLIAQVLSQNEHLLILITGKLRQDAHGLWWDGQDLPGS